MSDIRVWAVVGPNGEIYDWSIARTILQSKIRFFRGIDEKLYGVDRSKSFTFDNHDYTMKAFTLKEWY